MRKHTKKRWGGEEDRYLLRTYDEVPITVIARNLDRTVQSLRARYGRLRRNGATGKQLETKPVAEKTGADPGKDLCLWYVAQAYDEGYEVVIPEIGATFQKSSNGHNGS